MADGPDVAAAQTLVTSIPVCSVKMPKAPFFLIFFSAHSDISEARYPYTLLRCGKEGRLEANRAPRRLANLCYALTSASDFLSLDRRFPTWVYSGGASSLKRLKSKLILANVILFSIFALNLWISISPVFTMIIHSRAILDER
jgi:hypothetical protein